MKILVFGKTGQVARELRRAAQVVALGRDDVELSDTVACRTAIRHHAPDAVINAAAYTWVDRAEEDEARAYHVNSDAPAAMAQACVALDIPFVTISTDYVFDGHGVTPWSPGDATGPLGAYGRTKLAGETAVCATQGRFAILRTSWVFSVHGNNFVKTMLRLGRTRDELAVVGDQIGGPTAAADIAAACLSIATALSNDKSKAGIYHFSGAPDVSWSDFAVEIFKQAGIDCAVRPIPSSDYPTPAKRPANSRMDCTTTTHTFAVKRPDWRTSLAKVLNELGSEG